MKKHRPLLKILASTILIGASALAVSSALAQCNFVESAFVIHNKTKNWYLQLQIEPWNDNDFHGTMQVGNTVSDIADQPPRIPPGGDGTLTIQSPQIRDYEQMDAMFRVGDTAEAWQYDSQFYVTKYNPAADRHLSDVNTCALHFKYGMNESPTGDGKATLTSVGVHDYTNRTLITCKQIPPNEVEVTDVAP